MIKNKIQNIRNSRSKLKTTKSLLILFSTIILITLSILYISYSQQNKIDYRKPWIVLSQIALSYQNPTPIDPEGDGTINPQFLNITLDDVAQKGATTLRTINVGGLNSAGSVVVGGTTKINNDLVVKGNWFNTTGDINLSNGLIVTRNGNLGIGTSSPAYKLDVNGDLNAALLCIGGTCINSWNEVSSNYANLSGYGSSNFIAKWKNDSFLIPSIIYEDSTGSIGIGTTSIGIVEVMIKKSATLPTGRHALSCTENSATNKIYCFGGWDGTNYLNEILEYDPSTDTITTKTATLPTGRWGLSCTENSATNKIYCFGGYYYDGTNRYYYNEILEYDPSTDTITTKTATLPTGRRYLSCAENSATNKIYCFGGYDGTYLNEILEYDPSTDTITTKTATLPTGRNALSCTENSATNKIYCFGGYYYDGTNRYYYNEILEYDPSTDTITTKTATLPTGRYVLSCAENSATNKIYCFGGWDGTNYLNEILEYDPSTDTITTKTATLPTRRFTLSCTENSATNKIYCFGGRDSGGYLNEILELFNQKVKLDIEGYVQAYGYETGDLFFQKDGKLLWRMYEDEQGLYTQNLITGKTNLILSTQGALGINITTPIPQYTLDVNGDIRTTGCLIYNGGTLGTCISDIKLKTNIKNLTFTNALQKLLKLQPKTFNLNKDNTNITYSGLIAQEVENIAPELIVEINNTKYIKYQDVQWLMLEAIKEQQREIDLLKQKLCKFNSGYAFC